MSEINPNTLSNHKNGSNKPFIRKNHSPFNLSAQQQTLYTILFKKNQKQADIYFGALKVLNDIGNPDRLSLAAHNIRELMEEIPSIVNVQIPIYKGNLKGEVQNLKKYWEDNCNKSRCYNDQAWNGQIDGSLSKILKRLEKFFKWFGDHYPRRRIEVIGAFRKFDNSGRILPEDLEKLNYEYWDEMRQFFLGVAHHNKYPLDKEFNQWLDALEIFLLDKLRPRTFTDFDTIDAIIQEGENDA